MYFSGLGYDTHVLVEERDLILGGVKVPYQLGLLGHSDADVLIHAICDSLLGAAGLGDIGQHFPDTDSSYKDVDSRLLLRKVRELVSPKFRIINVDATIICQSPKLSPYIKEMQKNMSLDIGCDYVNIKATTTEKMNAEGLGKCISAQAICSLKLRD